MCSGQAISETTGVLPGPLMGTFIHPSVMAAAGSMKMAVNETS